MTTLPDNFDDLLARYAGKVWLEKYSPSTADPATFDDDDYNESFDENGGVEEWFYAHKEFDIPGVGHVKFVDQTNTDNEIAIIIEVEGKLYWKTGYYSSYYGSEYNDGWTEVSAVVRPVTFYE